ncbi:bifunctional methylenetetrahydrofolate dehydrogenase/methenyltetrahydrofolate cyclohydrolase FolD [Pseudohaliea sp.]|uniref:bifunctional methylenetetrahydrofolate dehydrogenase/methenyltetrahydrofolate cyclohydrolase FolD n=1 Tax=Pseudohaliea sp. TaxID=2740289 RepID=UPI0032EA9563
MTAEIIDGKAFAARLRQSIGNEVTRLQNEHSLQPGLAVVLVGEDPASQVYVRNKGTQTREAGMQSFEHMLDVSVSENELLALIERLNDDNAVHGILVQLPLPAHIDESRILRAINPLKDVDGFHPVNVGGLCIGDPSALAPCTPVGCLLMLKDYFDGSLAGKNALVIGRSNIVGKPMAQLLLKESCTVTIAHSRTQDLPGVCRAADIVIAAVGRSEMVRGDWIKPGAVVIDVGINRIQSDETQKPKLVGDVAFFEAAETAGALTPVPGGVGPMTIACLLRNTVVSACRQAEVECRL